MAVLDGVGLDGAGLDGTGLDGTGWRSYPSWEVFGQQTPLGCTLAAPVSRHDHWLGARGAPVTVVFYGDYTNAASRSVYADLKQIESLAGRRLAVVYRHLVDLDSDKAAVRFAEAAEAAGAQGLFWAAHDLFYRHVQTSTDDIAIAAAEIGIDSNRLQHDLAHRSFLPTVLKHRNGAHDERGAQTRRDCSSTKWRCQTTSRYATSGLSCRKSFVVPKRNGAVPMPRARQRRRTRLPTRGSPVGEPARALAAPLLQRPREQERKPVTPR